MVPDPVPLPTRGFRDVAVRGDEERLGPPVVFLPPERPRGELREHRLGHGAAGVLVALGAPVREAERPLPRLRLDDPHLQPRAREDAAPQAEVVPLHERRLRGEAVLHAALLEVRHLAWGEAE